MSRSLVYKVGRRLYTWARREVPNVAETNGEYWLVQQAVERASEGALFMDIGANRGDWTDRVLSEARARNVGIRIEAFEPSSATRALLVERFAGNPSVDVLGTALSNESGSAVFFSSRTGSGTNSLHPESGDNRETVPLMTLDAFLSERHIEHVTFAKIDTEGFDALVLLGAAQSLKDGRLDLVQFEYNWRWLLNAQSLRSIFEMIEGTPYRLGKLTGSQVLVFGRWHFEMDRFFEGNYVLIREGGPFEGIGTDAYYDSSNVLRY